MVEYKEGNLINDSYIFFKGGSFLGVKEYVLKINNDL